MKADSEGPKLETGEMKEESGTEVLPVHVAMLSSYIPPHQLENYNAYSRQFKRFTVLVSTLMERHRQWDPNFGSLDVQLQKTWTLSSRWRHRMGFTDSVDIHVPINTISMLRRLAPDVIVSGELGGRSLASAVYAKFVHKTPLILWVCVSEHTENGRGAMRSMLRRWLLKRADAIIVNGASGGRYVKKMGAKEQHVFEIPYCSQKGFYDTCPLERNDPAAHRLLMVGQLVERKGVLPFLKHLSMWGNANPNRNVHLTVVGDGVLRDEAMRFVVPKNICIEFVGKKTHEELKAIYSEAGILVFPTLADEWGLVVNEAFAAGLPVLGSVYSGAVEELCTEGVTGWKFRPDDSEESVLALDRALNCSVADLNRMRSHCRQLVDNITPDTCARKLAVILESVLSRREGGSNRG